MSTPDAPLGLPEAAAATDHAPAASEWRRLSWRSLLISPLKSIWDAVPAMAPLLVLGFSQGGHARWLIVAALTLPVAITVLSWFFTGYRLTGEQLQVRRGILRKQVLTAQLDRIRTVNSESSAMRRLLRVTNLEISTGSDSPIKLDGVETAEAASLREVLLRRSHAAAPPAGDQDAVAAPGEASPTPTRAPAPDEAELARFDPAWLRLAPLTLSGLATVAAAVGLFINFADDLHLAERITPWLQDAWESRPEQAPAVLAAEAALGTLVTITVLSVVAYALANWGYRLTRRPDGTLHVSRGLLTSRATTIEESRLRGAVVEQPWLLSLGRGARAEALLTGAGEGGQKSTTSNVLVVPAPRDVVRRAVADVLGADGPVRVRVAGHGVAAMRRRWTRAYQGAVPLALIPPVVARTTDLPMWVAAWGLLPLALAAPIALRRARGLGHEVVPDYLVAAEGGFPHRRSMLRTRAIIGWVMSETWFQRRVGLVTLSATVAAGHGAVRVLDVPRAEAVGLMRALTPHLVEPRVVEPGPATSRDAQARVSQRKPSS